MYILNGRLRHNGTPLPHLYKVYRVSPIIKETRFLCFLYPAKTEMLVNGWTDIQNDIVPVYSALDMGIIDS